MDLYEFFLFVLSSVSPKITQEAIIPEATAQVHSCWREITTQEITTQVPDYKALSGLIHVATKKLVIRLPRFLKILELLGEVIKQIQRSGIFEVFDYYMVDTLFGIIRGTEIRQIFKQAKIYINGSQYSMKIPLALLIAKIMELLGVINSLQTRCQVNEFVEELMCKLSSDGKLGCLTFTDIRCRIFTYPATYFLTLSAEEEKEEEYVNNQKLRHLEYTIYWVAMLFVLGPLLELQKYFNEDNQKDEDVEEFADNYAKYDHFEPKKNSNKSEESKKSPKKYRRSHPPITR